MYEPEAAPDISAALAEAAAKVLSCYRAFAAQPPPDDARGYAAHHAACRSALAHLDLALRLARRYGASDCDDAEAMAGDALIEQARAALDGEGPPADDDIKDGA